MTERPLLSRTETVKVEYDRKRPGDGILRAGAECAQPVVRRESFPRPQPELLDRRKLRELDGVQGDARSALALLAYGNHVVIAQIEANERYVIAHQSDLLVSPEHLLDAGQPGHRLLILTIGIGEGEIDACLHRLALPHFVEQVVHGSEATTPAMRVTCRKVWNVAVR